MRLPLVLVFIAVFGGILFCILDSFLYNSQCWPFRRSHTLLLTRSQLYELYIVTTTFYEKTGRLPESSKEIHEVTKYYNGYDQQGFYADGWGSPIRYVKKNDGVLIYSIGKNRKDESAAPGLGDDIQVSGDGKDAGDYDLRYGRLVKQ